MFLVCVCRLIYPACNVRVSYYIVICGLSGSVLFFHVISKTVLFSEMKISIIKGVLRFCLNVVCEIFLILRKIRYASIQIKCLKNSVRRSSYKVSEKFGTRLHIKCLKNSVRKSSYKVPEKFGTQVFI
jgi:hypothetical protein